MRDFNFISVSGYGWSGSGAYVSLLKEFYGFGGPDGEFRLVKDPFGLIDLESSLVNNWDFIRHDVSIRDFLWFCNLLSRKGSLFGKMGLSFEDKLFVNFFLESENYIVLIKHPLSSEVESAGEQMETALKSLEAFCDKHNFQVVCIPPNSDPGSHKMKMVLEKYSEKDWLIKAETLPRLQFINLMRHARALVGNSSMGILEAPHYKLPAINIGNRQQGRLNAGNVEFVP